MKTSIVFITFGDFNNPTDGGSRFSREVFEALRSVGNVNAISYYEYSGLKSKLIRKAVSVVTAFIRRIPMPVAYFYSSKLVVAAKKSIAAELKSNKHGKVKVYIDHLELCYLVKALRAEFGGLIEIIHLSHNVEPVLLKQRLGGGGLYKYSQFCCDYSYFEKKALGNVDTILSISDEERHYFSRLNDIPISIKSTKVLTVPPTFSYHPLLESSRQLGHKKIVFIASFDWWPNLQAFQWIRDHLSTKLPPGFKIHVYGKNSKKYSDGQPDNIVFHGYVENILEVWDGCFFSIAPITQGAGVNIKVAESLHNKVPVIGTSLSFGGISNDFLNGTLSLDLDAKKWVEAFEFYSKHPMEYESLKSSISYPSKKDIVDLLRTFA